MYAALTAGEMPVPDGETPIRLVTINGVPSWQAGSRILPLIAGGDGEPDPPAEDDDADDDEEEKFDANRARNLIAKLRLEAKAGKATAKELEAARKKLKEREDADLSETEKLRKDLADLKTERESLARERQVIRDEQAIYEAAVAEKAVKPKLIIRLIDREAIEHDDSGKPTNAEKLVKELIKNEPYLKGEPNGAQGVPGTPRASGQPGHEDRVNENKEKLQKTGLYGRF